MRILNPTKSFLPFALLSLFLINSGVTTQNPRLNNGANFAYGQTRERTVAIVPNNSPEVIKTDVDLVTVDALVLQKNTSRVVGDLRRDDFLISEDGKSQEITHFSQGSLPLSVLLLIDRGGCLDPFNTQVRHAAADALARLKPTDEVAVMTYHNNADLLQQFTRDRWPINFALDHIPPHDEMANHCINKAFYEAATYMEQAANPSGRRVIIFITGVTRNFDCSDGPGGKTALHALYESGSVVCGLVPVTKEQQMENGMMRWATRVGGLMRVSTLNIKQVATDTGGEVLEDKPELLDQTFATLMEHLRSRFSLAFVSTNKLRDGSLRKLKIELKPEVKKTRGELVVKSRKSYVAPRG
ncbi:MAG TPA: VWA domain-containing protein [Pyrinomonadaceae bacterium]|nr:VWA domain-containing protein [Pyrinomonadaceae bacterium]